jgi:hypothetical protein
MALVQVTGIVDGLTRPIQGDLLDLREGIFGLAVAGNTTLLGAAIARGVVSRTGPTADYSDTVDFLENIIAALSSSAALMPANVTFEDIYQPSGRPSAGSTFRFMYRNTVAYVATLLTNTGITLTAPTAIAASSVREYLCTFTNTTRVATLLGTSTNGSPILTNVDPNRLDSVSIGQLVTAGAGISAGTLVTQVNKTAGTVTMSANATATQSVAFTFNPTMSIRGLWQAAL